MNSKSGLKGGGPVLTGSVLTIGTEVCDGEILNSNARWLAEKLLDHGIQPIRHLTVPDDEVRMKEALNQCMDSDIVVTTGGLGPTRDDFTTRVIGEWAGKPLFFSETSWSRIQVELTARGLKIFDNHRQQCYFPEGAHVLSNRLGTADAFRTETRGRHLIVLPGPPSEIAGIYEDHLKSYWGNLARSANSTVDVLKVWLCLGISESELADRLEKIPNFSKFRVGFRPHVPYITFKIWASSQEDLHEIESQIDASLAPWVVNKTDSDPLESWLEAFMTNETEVLLVSEEWTKGKLTKRLLQSDKNQQIDLISVTSKIRFEEAAQRFLTHDRENRTWVGVRLHRDGARDTSWFLEFYGPTGHYRAELDAPRAFSEKNIERMLSFAIEKSLVHMCPLGDKRIRGREFK